VDPKLKSFLRGFLPRQIRKRRIWAGPLRGHMMVTSWRDNFSSLTGRTEPDVNRWFGENALPGETWLDIGANYGYTALRLATIVGKQGRVFAFEPKLTTCGHLSETVSLNGLTNVISVIPFALGTPESAEIRQFSTAGSMAVGFNRPEGPSETVGVARLDWLWPRIAGGNERVDGVKIDVQGMEMEVLRGMTGLLAEQTPKLIIELHHGVDRGELFALLEDCGYAHGGIPVCLAAETPESPLYRDNLSYAFKRRDFRPR
jgi:FkbM family methyltransferase